MQQHHAPVEMTIGPSSLDITLRVKDFSGAPEQYWLRQIMKDRRAQSRSPGPSGATESEKPYMERAHAASEGEVPFCGITTSFEGIVDTAAEGGLVGRGPLQRLEQELSMRGLCIKWVPKQTSAKGVEWLWAWHLFPWALVG